MKDTPIIYTVKFIFIAILTAGIILLIGISFGGYIKGKDSDTSLPASTNNDKFCIVLDAGHGGEDCGAVAGDGTLEKDLNLDIAKLIYGLCELNCTDVIMTRDSDVLLYDFYGDLDDYTGKKKIYDLKNRLKIAESVENSVYVGIHMNKFSQEKYSGLQVYYSPNDPSSQALAGLVCESVKSYVQPQNNRKIKMADSSIYILDNINRPAILIECGFLSNENELNALKAPEYRTLLSVGIFSSLLTFVDN